MFVLAKLQFCIIIALETLNLPSMLFRIPTSSDKLHQLLTPGQFLRVLKTNRGAIKRTKFIAPKLGSSGFGKIYVEYNYVPKQQANVSACEI